ncbi:MAG: hypothetical protein EOM59_04120 [Clostridia bacterium]|nr:hypothetical protein [Clostridia bacterium]
MRDIQILKFNEEDLYPMARKYFIGYNRLKLDNEKHARMMKIGDEARLAGLSGIDVKAVVSYWGGSCIQNGKLIKEGVSLECTALSQIAEGVVKRIYAFVITAGECLYSDSDPITTQLFADTWGTAYVDVARVVMAKAFKKDMSKSFPNENLFFSAYIGPGFYGMPMVENIQLCKLLSAEEIGVKARDSGLMVPVKSCSGFYLATTDLKAMPRRSCEDCVGNPKGCAYCLSKKK